MRLIVQIISWLALAATLTPAVLYLAGGLDLAQAKTWMLVATVVWFASVPLWMGRKHD
jgi:hypothetical protein